jgi:hypothetical protein
MPALDLDAALKRVDTVAELALHPDEEAAPLTVEEGVALAAELRAAREARDENLANVRRIDGLRIAETARLNRQLEGANEVIDAYREYQPGSMPMVDAALAAYDQLTGGGDTP